MLSATETLTPGEASSAGSAVATGVPEQSAVVNRANFESARAVPLIFGLFSFAGELGSLPVSCGAGCRLVPATAGKFGPLTVAPVVSRSLPPPLPSRFATEILLPLKFAQ